jgi:AcrR family transcriptional regulator
MDVRSQLIQAALQVYAEAGSRGATTRRIAEVAGVNEVTLFRHFGSKDALVRRALERVAEDALSVRLPAEPADPGAELLAFCVAQHRGLTQVRALVRRTMAEHQEHPEAASVAQHITAGIDKELRTYLERVRVAGFTRERWETRVACAMLLGTLFADAVGRDCLPDRYPTPAEDAVAGYVGLFCRALGVAAAVPAPVRRRRTHQE